MRIKIVDVLGRSKWKLDPRESKRSMSKLWSAAEHCKHCLSTLNTAHCFVESLHEGVDLSANVSRARIDMLITQMLPAYLEPVRECLDQTRLTSKDIDKVAFVGNILLFFCFFLFLLFFCCRLS